jgi:hypothetical protein
MRRLRLVLILVVVGAVPIGCGGDGSGSSNNGGIIDTHRFVVFQLDFSPHEWVNTQTGQRGVACEVFYREDAAVEDPVIVTLHDNYRSPLYKVPPGSLVTQDGTIRCHEIPGEGHTIAGWMKLQIRVDGEIVASGDCRCPASAGMTIECSKRISTVVQ